MASLERFLGEVVDHVIGINGINGYGMLLYRKRLEDGRLNYSSAASSACQACDVHFTKEPYGREQPCPKDFRPHCPKFALARKIEKFGSRENVESQIEGALRERGFAVDEVSFGRGNAENLSISIRFSEAARDDFNSRKVKSRTLSKLYRQYAEVNAFLDSQV